MSEPPSERPPSRPVWTWAWLPLALAVALVAVIAGLAGAEPPGQVPPRSAPADSPWLQGAAAMASSRQPRPPAQAVVESLASEGSAVPQEPQEEGIFDDEPGPELDHPIELPAPVARMTHVVTHDDTLEHVLHLYGLSRDRLRELNGGAPSKSLIVPGRELLVYEQPAHFKSISVGRANEGYLIDGIPLPPGPGYKLAHRHRAFGTQKTIELLERVLDVVHSRYPEAHPLLVGDISFASGHRITPHKSHRTGRDVDLGFFHRGLEDPTRFESGTRESLDLDKTWFLVEQLVLTGQVEYIFLDWRIQHRMRQLAEAQGYDEATIDAWFQYPAWGNKPNAIIRHEKGHFDHIHVRFTCDVMDERCR